MFKCICVFCIEFGQPIRSNHLGILPFGEVLLPANRGEPIFEKCTPNENPTIVLLNLVQLPYHEENNKGLESAFFYSSSSSSFAALIYYLLYFAQGYLTEVKNECLLSYEVKNAFR